MKAFTQLIIQVESKKLQILFWCGKLLDIYDCSTKVFYFNGSYKWR